MVKRLIAFVLVLVVVMSVMAVTGFAVVNCPKCRSTDAAYYCSGQEYRTTPYSHYYSSLIPNCNYVVRQNWNSVWCNTCKKTTATQYYYHTCYSAGHICTGYANEDYCPY